ncbi:MAG: Nudix family hydrolase, partial [Gammaproteobacteria bacterium]|nr:Nudix family hydrolase [Gammaproteobacteria bacterium]
EFPGGKVEPGEDIKTALARELQEELGLIVVKARPFIKLHYDYPDQSVVLNVWLINRWHGQIHSKEGQFIQWIEISKLPGLDFPAADKAVIKAIQLPSLYLISPGPTDSLDEYLFCIEKCLKAGARLLQLRCKKAIYTQYPDLVTKMLEICNAYKAKFLLNSTPATAVFYNTHGVHLSSARLLQLNHRPLDTNYWVAASCHNQNELQHACRIGVDFVVLSPVESTPSHPEANPLGWERFVQLAEYSTVPVYALGGMRPVHLRKAWDNGAQGVAMLSGVWSANNPADVIRKCVERY